LRRIVCPERDDWQATAAAMGFAFHSEAGQRYWDERAYYAFTLDEIEHRIEATTAELDAMCRELVGRAVGDDRYLRLLKIPPAQWSFIAESWQRRDPSLYGRFDLVYDGRGPARLLEFNADTPTSLFEAAVFQWTWLEQAIERQIVPKRADQYNSLHENLIEVWRGFGPSKRVHVAATMSSAEDRGTVLYLADVAKQAGLDPVLIDMAEIGLRKDGAFIDLQDQPICLAFKLYPWEWMFREAFGAKLPGATTRWIEPPWKAILSNKGILPLLWAMFPNHPNLLPAFFDDDPAAAALGTSYVRKPLYSREGANVTIVSGSEALEALPGPYGAEGFIRQALMPLPEFSGQYPVLGSWLVGDTACGLSIREDDTPITSNLSRFVPHAIV
jgi:glutathionylspermidine synthase